MQDVALKIVAKRVPFADAAALARFAHHAARHRWIDLARQADVRRTDASPDVDGVSADVAPAVIESLTARRVLRELRARDRAALFDGGDASDVVRHRARVRLDRLWESLGAWAGAVSLRRARRAALGVGGATALAIVVGVPAFRLDVPPHPSGTPASRSVVGAVDAPARTTAAAATSVVRPAATSVDARPYHERVTLPTTHARLGPGDHGVINAGTRPTQSGDAIVCVFKLPVVGTRCVGDASGSPR